MQRHYKPGDIKNPARTPNGPALDNIMVNFMPTVSFGLELKKKKKKKKRLQKEEEEKSRKTREVKKPDIKKKENESDERIQIKSDKRKKK